MIVICLFFGMSFQGLPGFAQEVYPFTKTLFATVGTRYGREALYTDPLAWQLYNHSLKAPVEGGVFGTDDKGQNIVWKELSADSANRFRMRGMRGGGFGTGAGGSYFYLSYVSDREKTALLHVKGSSGLFFNGTPHAGDPYSSGWFYVPVMLKKGLNEIYLRPAGMVEARLVFTNKAVELNVEDPTIPVIVPGAAGNDSLHGAVVVFNNSAKVLRNYRLRAVLEGKEYETEIPAVQAMSTRKVSFAFSGVGVTAKGRYDCALTLMDKGKAVDEKKLQVEAVRVGDQYSVTFTSGIDGSLQYYAVTPQSSGVSSISGTNAGGGSVTEAAPPGTVGSEAGKKSVTVGGVTITQGPALFLSVHGAGVEAIGQARAYRSKDWGTLVAATNRRPRGFNWEDWGRMDALEVLSLAEARFHPDPQLIFLTGHSMGGHGTWFLGATYPDKWAAIGACSGYPTLKDYGSHDGVVPDSGQTALEQILIRASDQSDMIKLATNYKPMGVYILHGDSDKVVPVKYARQMRKILADFHQDMVYHEVPGAEHWYGNQSVDWKPLFDFFQWHSRKPDSLVNHIDFMTASPGISASYYWATIQQQFHPLSYSRMQLARSIGQGTITGTTENIRMLKFSLIDFGAHAKIKIDLDGLPALQYTTVSAGDSLFLFKDHDAWTVASWPGAGPKGPQRYGTLKDAFNYNMVFVYGTTGSKEENEWSFNKARYDAETWYYRGNGAMDIVSDKEFKSGNYTGRGVILFGNANTNAAYDQLLRDCPIRVERGSVKAGEQVWKNDELGAYFVWPLKNSPVSSVAVIGGSGLKGMEAANANQYFAGASGFPDFMIFGLDMLKSGSGGIKMAGFFDNDWKLVKSDWEVNP
jgi:pimeloyl-ACP methyl ester carboxylesterase